MGRAVIAHCRRLLYGDPLSIVLLHIGQNLLHLFPHFIAPLLPRSRPSLAGCRQIKEPEKPALNPQLIRVSPLPGNSIHPLDADRKFLIPFPIFCDIKRLLCPALRQGKKKTVRPRVLPARHQKLQPKNDIFVLHRLSCPPADAVKLSGKYKEELPLSHLIPLSVHRHNSPAFFYRNDLHLLVPVNRHPGKIHRNGTRINGKREVPVPMFFFLLKTDQTLFFRNSHIRSPRILIVLYYIIPEFCKHFKT